MLAPVKIVLISTSLLSIPKVEKPIILDQDYSIEAMRYRIQENNDSTTDINNLMYKSIIKEIKEKIND